MGNHYPLLPTSESSFASAAAPSAYPPPSARAVAPSLPAAEGADETPQKQLRNALCLTHLNMAAFVPLPLSDSTDSADPLPQRSHQAGEVEACARVRQVCASLLRSLYPRADFTLASRLSSSTITTPRQSSARRKLVSAWARFPRESSCFSSYRRCVPTPRAKIRGGV